LEVVSEVKKRVAILGSTGSIGCNALELIGQLEGRFEVTGLAAGRNTRLLLEQAARFKPKIVSLESRADAEEFRRKFGGRPLKVTFGPDGAEEVAGYPENDVIVSSITGINGLRPTLAALRTGRKVALANKESMVVAGPLLRREAKKSGAQIIPIDSEHSGVFQCLAGRTRTQVTKVILTASGGPFFKTPLRDLKKKTLEETLSHPRWKMGKKVTVDSATLMNKGLELLEARWLFNLRPAQLGILIHPQSIVHALVEVRGGSVLAQLSQTNMKIPILYALTYPEREDVLLPSLHLSEVKRLEFFAVDERRYPLIRLAYRALEEGESYPVALNAANEMAVSAFLERKLSFSDMPKLIAEVMDCHQKRIAHELPDILEVDRTTREQAGILIKRRF
jgi:1-deoxy-D-xylulose-5-phosphate reductoisomerase